MIIAATAEPKDRVVVTDNQKDFTGIAFLNPPRVGGATNWLGGVLINRPACPLRANGTSGQPWPNDRV
jgi:hypothetical protein